MTTRAVLFDLDGTLVDTVPDLAASVNAALVDCSVPARTLEEIRSWIGNGADALIRRAIAGDTHGDGVDDLFSNVKRAFLQHYENNLCVHSELYDGATDLLSALRGRGVGLGIVTNKPFRFVEPLLEALGIREPFSVVIGGDSLAKKKPDPLPLLTALEQLKAEPNAAWMVGDSVNDVQAARNAGIRVACVPYGYNHGGPIADAEPDVLVDNLADLVPLLGLA